MRLEKLHSLGAAGGSCMRQRAYSRVGNSTVLLDPKVSPSLHGALPSTSVRKYSLSAVSFPRHWLSTPPLARSLPNPAGNRSIQSLNWLPIASFHGLACQENQDGVPSYSTLLQSCASPSALAYGMRLHHNIVRDALELHPFIQNLVLHMYCKCGALREARHLFTLHPERDLFSWDFFISACILHGSTEEALKLFERMQQEAILPDKVLFSSALSACSTTSNSLDSGQRLHACIRESPFISDIVLRTALVSLYSKCGAVDQAQQLFNESQEFDKISYNAMIETYVEHGHGEEAIYVFDRMQWQGLMPNISTFVSLLSVCTNAEKRTVGKAIHVKVLASRVDSDIHVATALISMYGRCGDLELAKLLFGISNDRDVVMWNALLAAYAQNGRTQDAFTVFEQMQQESFLSNKVTFISILQACSTEAMFFQGQQVHTCITCEGHDLDVTVGNSLVTMYGSCGKLGNAQDVFEKLPEKNIISWTAMITACAQHGHAEGACYFLYRMHQEGLSPNEVTLVSVISAHTNLPDPIACKQLHTWLIMEDFTCVGNAGNALISLYAKCGCVRDAQVLLSQLAEKDEVSWNALISGCSQTAYGEDALCIYEQMQLEGVLPNSASFASVLAACAEQADLLKGRQIHVQILNIELTLDDCVWNSMLNMYNKCGVMMEAYTMFNEMAFRNLVSWNSMITGFAQHGEGEHALHLLTKMVEDRVEPDSKTFMSVMAACIHSGLVDESLSVIIMVACIDRVATLDHLNCLIDAVGRLGRIAESWQLLAEMPFLPNRASYLGMLNSCRHHGDVMLGQTAMKCALELVPDDTTFPVLMSNLYGMVGAEEFY
ncbi:hypothetical protein GOP47_0015176 [Adiantum capillus-veneris]|uniref:Pentatricopeptide repeat-containing protein n=1 Tax=Adiantum capillus-veneris TaxID=13818 RepID=A0A9D4UP44_ADICA|nr:hypothetical protein GOP47_0015176 [Adiantum capillus-veneris]